MQTTLVHESQRHSTQPRHTANMSDCCLWLLNADKSDLVVLGSINQLRLQSRWWCNAASLKSLGVILDQRLTFNRSSQGLRLPRLSKQARSSSSVRVCNVQSCQQSAWLLQLAPESIINPDSFKERRTTQQQSVTLMSSCSYVSSWNPRIPWSAPLATSTAAHSVQGGGTDVQSSHDTTRQLLQATCISVSTSSNVSKMINGTSTIDYPQNKDRYCKTFDVRSQDDTQ